MLVRWLGTRTFRRAEGRLATNGWINGDWLTTGDWKKLPRECGGFKLVGTRAVALPYSRSGYRALPLPQSYSARRLGLALTALSDFPGRLIDGCIVLRCNRRLRSNPEATRPTSAALSYVNTSRARLD